MSQKQVQPSRAIQAISDVQRVREQLVNMSLNYFAVCAPLLLGLSLLRIYQQGWLWIYNVQIAVALLVIVVAIIKRHLPAMFRALLVVFPWIVVGWSGTLAFGMGGGGSIILVLSTIVTTIVMGMRAGIIMIVANILFIVGVATCVQLKILDYSSDAVKTMSSLSTWLNLLSVFILWAPAIIFALGTIYRNLINIAELNRQNETKYREIFDAVTDAIFIHNAGNGKIMDVNASMLRMYGYDRAEVIGQTIAPFSAGTPGYDAATAKENLASIGTDGARTFEWHGKRKSGELFWAEVTLQRSSISNERCILAVVRDMTDRKRANEILIHNEKMMSLGGLAAGMAHEINNPLGGMIQISQVMTSRLKSELPGNVEAAQKAGTSMEAIQQFMESRQIYRMLAELEDSGKRAADIVSNMLSFVRKGNTPRTAIFIPNLIDQTINLSRTDYDLKKKYDFKHIQIETHYENDIPPIYCDPGKIQQVLINILRNGAQAMAEAAAQRQKQDVPPRFVIRVRLEPDQDMVCIEISDNGPGMDESVCKRIFEPFFTTREVGEGTGLGLSVSYFIITQEHRGEMTVISEKEQGTTFIIRLPTDIRRVARTQPA